MRNIFNSARVFALAGIVALGASAFSPQADTRLKTKTGHVWFSSHAKEENITAHNYQVGSALDTKTGAFAAKMAIKSFEFQLKEMQAHFNENYMESEKYPEASFVGNLTDINAVNFSKNGSYKVSAAGKLTIHGVTRDVTAPGTITVRGKETNVKSEFTIALKDYGIAVPSAVTKKIAENIDINVDITYK